ncbi:hypothetical protein V6U89_29845 [Micromonospora sp. CPCC 206171]|uniref:hypothetical protein n=1 Tax=Micromonospora sp. CPCC 206171 TaxID=3122405 RepID=UPI002FEE9295
MTAIIIKLAAADADRFGLAEVSCDPFNLNFQEIRALRNEVGLNLAEFIDLCRNQAEWYYALGVIIWLGLIRAGERVPFADFNADVMNADLSRDEAAADPNSLAPDGASSN